LARSRRRTDQRSRRRSTPEQRPSPQETQSLPLGQRPKTRVVAAAAIVALGVLAAGLTWQLVRKAAPSGGPNDAVASLAFAGSETCASCHETEAKLWRTSHHKLAMDHATDASVLGDFSGATFTYYGVQSRFCRKDSKFFVETDGPDGKLAVFEVKYTFGVYPLQQYLIEFPDGRLQALSIAWDSRAKAKGGQRWFHLYPNEDVRHDDFLHWTKLNQNWNFMCAECHSTGVRKNYDTASDRFATTFAEISVGCEACHGQGSAHVDWARGQQSWWPFGKKDDPAKGLVVRFDERRDVTWTIDPTKGNATRSVTPPPLRKEVESCGLCHARRSQFSEDWVPGQWLSDTHNVSTLSRGLYHADGQMQDEVYNYGSFKQSKMFAAGVTCSDCHEPHGATLRFPDDNVCLQCHASPKYAAAAHHRHEAASPPLGCPSCHMAVRTYMVVDPRHDHSFRIPRPDVSEKLGTPNACNDCHTDKTAQWAAEAIERWHGPDRKGFQHYAEAFHYAWQDQPDAGALLSAVTRDTNTPAFARASALTEFASHALAPDPGLAAAGLADPDPMVRIGALDMLENVPAPQIWPLVSPLLSDPSRGVRIRAAALLAAVPPASQPPADRDRFERAAAEFIAAQRLNADRPEARTALGSFYARRGLVADAEAEYQAALRLAPQFAPAAVNLADLYRSQKKDGDGESVLRSAIAKTPNDAGLHHALGLALIRLKRADEALPELRQAAGLEPAQARYAYVYAVALQSAGRGEEAMKVLKESLTQHPGNRDILLALITFSRDAGDLVSALEYAERLASITPDDRGLANFVEDLRRHTNEQH
jgi:predicted CXXCH cytochrome family protein